MRTICCVCFCGWMLAALPLLSAANAQSECRVEQLRCEYRENPLGIDIPQPRLSWIIDSSRRGCQQTAYRILVSRDPQTLTSEKADTWDSGKIVSNQSNQIPYGGPALLSNARYFWKVRIWDEKAGTSDWSETASWTCGLMHPSDWRATWIQHDEPSTQDLDFDGAQWIWHDEPGWHTAEQQLAPPNAPGGETIYLQRQLVRPSGRQLVRARLFSAMDNEGTVWLNGQQVLASGTFLRAPVQDVTRFIRPGSNLLAAQMTNLADYPNPAGFLAKLIMEFSDGTTESIVTDGSWRSSNQVPADDWRQRVCDEWSHAVAVADWGDEPWGERVMIQAQHVLPLFRKEFHIEQQVERALVHVAGLGHYELSLNGETAGNRFLDPAWSVYEKTVYYTTYDVTQLLKPGANAVGVMLGKGFYDTAGDRRIHCVDVSRPLKLILQMQLQFSDGSSTEILTDGSWRAKAGPITHCAILGGSDFDARRIEPTWNSAGHDDSTWAPVRITTGPGGRLRASEMPPMVTAATFPPTKIEQVEPGVFVYDFGQNASARPRLQVAGASGQTIRLTPAEQRFQQSDRTNDGSGRVNQAGVGKPNYWEYTLRGSSHPETWCPPFTYSGFQYLELTGGVPAGQPNPDGLPVVTQLESLHVRNAAREIGHFECSNTLLNDIDRVIDWAVRSNLAHVLTDCPHREKLGWLEVPYLMGPSIGSRYDIALFYSKVARDIRESQAEDGAIYTVAPRYPRFPGEAFEYTPEWGAAGVVIPWQVYRRYGDRRVLLENYNAMKRFVDYMRATSDELIAKPGLGDWCDYGHGEGPGPSKFTPPTLTATAIFYYCACIVSDTAGILERAAEKEAYDQLAMQIKRRFQAEFYEGDGIYKNSGSPQTANSMALSVGLVPADHQPQVVEAIVADLKARDNQQTAGDVGFHFLVDALARHGRSDILFRIANRRSLGSYGFVLDRGWTSMPETWDVNTSASLNHLMLGHIQQWFYQDLLGIQNAPSDLAYKRIVIRPQVVGDLEWARGHYDSMFGRIAVHWKRDAGLFLLDVTIPANTTATVFLPTSDAAKITDRGDSIANATGVRLVQHDATTAELNITSGSYHLAAPLSQK
jgi:alpha-L-rhamnosidase